MIPSNIHSFDPSPSLTELESSDESDSHLQPEAFRLVSHECSRVSVLPFFRIELRSLGKIAEGEELTVAYVDFLNLSEERRRLLKTQYFFDCQCDHCKNHTKDDLKLAGREVDGVKVRALDWLGEKLLNPIDALSPDMADKQNMRSSGATETNSETDNGLDGRGKKNTPNTQLDPFGFKSCSWQKEAEQRRRFD